MPAFNLFKYSSPRNFYFLAGKLIPWFAVIAILLTIVGLYVGFFLAPTDFQQGEAYRIIFIHVPAAWMSMFIYLIMAGYAALGLIFNTPPVGHDGNRAGANGCVVYLCRTVDGRAMGQTDVGCMVGVGRQANLRTDFVVPVYWLYCAARLD